MTQPTDPHPIEDATNENPFPGLRPFREDEEHFFFGRDNQVNSMVDKLRPTHFLSVVGGSGSGKSSLVNCGLRPALQRGLMSTAGTSWKMVQFRPGVDPIKKMAQALSKDDVLFPREDDTDVPLAEFVETNLRMSKDGLIDIYKMAKLGENVNLLVVVDQFEELFRYRQLGKGVENSTFGVSEEATEFVNLLLAVREQLKIPIYVVLTMRSDFLGDCTQFAGLAEAINEGQYLVPRMIRDERRAAISGPVGVGEAEISPVLLTRLVNDVGDNPDQLSILQHALNRTWACWQEESGTGPLDLPHYEKIGTMAGALDHHAEEAYDELGTRNKQVCEKMFKALTDKATDPRGVRRPTTLASLCALAVAADKEVIEVIEIFRQPKYSFLMPPAGRPLEADTPIDISHESLMRVWKRLGKWADEEAISARIYKRLAETAELHEKGRAGLWKDPDLQLALKWKEENQPNKAWATQYYPEFNKATSFLSKSKAARGWRRTLAGVAAAGIVAVLLVFNAINVNARRKADDLATAAVKSEVKALTAKIRAEDQKKEAEKLKKAANEAEVDATEQRIVALNQKRIAEEQTRRADDARLAAEGQKNLAKASAEAERLAAIEAKEARDKALTANKTNERLLYSTDMFFVQNEIKDGQIDLARNRLMDYMTDPASAGNRGFEYYYLWDQLDQSDWTIGGHSGPLFSVAYSPDGNTLATGGEDMVIRLWDVETQRRLKSLKGHNDWVRTVAFSPDGTTLATGSDDKSVMVWNVATGNEIATLKGHDGWVLSVAFSSDNKTLATGSDDKTVKLWNVATGNEIATLKGHTGEVNSVAFSQNGTMLATGSDDMTVKLWNVATQKETATLKGHTGEVNSVAYSQNGTMFATGSADKTAKIWNVATRKEIATLKGHTGAVLSVAFSSDQSLLVTGGEDNRGKIWNVSTGELVTTLSGHERSVYSVSFAPRNNTLITGSGDGTGKRWDLTKLASTLPGHSGSLYSVANSPDGRMLATGGADMAISLWDVETRRQLASWKGHNDWVRTVAFSPDGTTLATGGDDMTVKLWNVATRKRITTLRGHTDWVNSVAFSPDGDMLATGSDNGTVRLWNVENHKRIATLRGHSGPVNSVVFSQNGIILASGGSDRSAKIWNVATRKEIATLKGHSGEVYSVAFSQNGTMLATGSADKTARIWNVATQQEIVMFQGHSGGVKSVVFSPDQKLLATGSLDNTLKLWNLEFGRQLVTLKGHLAGVTSLAFSKDGRTLASSSLDRTVRIWSVATDEAITRATAAERVDQGVKLATEGRVAEAIIEFKKAQQLDPDIDLDPSTETKEKNSRAVSGKLAVPAKVIQAIAIAKKGRIDVAISAFEIAQSADPDIDLNPDTDTIEKDPRTVATFFAAQAKLSEAQELANEGELDGAIAAFQKALELDPDIDLDPDTDTIEKDPRTVATFFAAQAKLSEAQELANEGELDGAIAAFQKALELDSDIDLDPETDTIEKDPRTVATFFAAQAKLSEAQELANEGELDGAIAAFQKALELDPDIDLNPDTDTIEKDSRTVATFFAAQAKLSEAQELANEGELDGAIAAFQKALELDSDIDLDPETDTIERDPRTVAKHFMALPMLYKGQELANEGELDGAIAAFQKALELDPDIDLDPETVAIDSDPRTVAKHFMALPMLYKGQELANEGELDGAIAAFQKALELDPDIDLDPETVAIDSDPRTVAKHFMALPMLYKGQELANEGELDGAIAAFQKALELDPDIDLNPDTDTIEKDPRTVAKHFMALPMLYKGQELVNKGELDGAIAAFQKALELDPDIDLDPETVAIDSDPKVVAQSARALTIAVQGMVQAITGKIDNSMTSFDKARRLAPLDATPVFLRCWFGSLNDRVTEVMSDCEEAVQLKTDEQGFVYDGRGLARALTGNMQGAIDDFRATIAWAEKEKKSPSKTAERKRWVEALQRGENPFTPEEMGRLRKQRP